MKLHNHITNPVLLMILFACSAYGNGWMWIKSYPWVYSDSANSWLYIASDGIPLVYNNDTWDTKTSSYFSELGWVWMKDANFGYSHKDENWIYISNHDENQTYIFSPNKGFWNSWKDTMATTSPKNITLDWESLQTTSHRNLAVSGASYRTEFEDSGQYEMVDMTEFAEKYKLRHEISGIIHKFYYSDYFIEWQEGREFFSDSRTSIQVFVLPVTPVIKENTLYFPVRILAERLGLLTKYESGEISVASAPEGFSKIPISLVKSLSTNESDISFSYFHTAYETKDSIYLVVDHAYDVYRFKKPDYQIEKISIAEKYGFISVFYIIESSQIMYIATTKGYFLSYNLNSKEIIEIIGKGSTRPTNIGDELSANEADIDAISQFVLDETDQNIAYVLTNDSLLKLNLSSEVIQVIADKNTIQAIISLGFHNGEPFVIDANVDPSLTYINPTNFSTRKNESFSQLFTGERVYGAKYLEKFNRWVVVLSSKKEIVEATLPDVYDSEQARILRRTSLGDEIAFINNFGHISSQVDSLQDTILIIDSDGYNLIYYDLQQGEASVLSNQTLAGGQRKILAPIGLLKEDNNLYIVGNLSHQVYKYSLATDTFSAYVGYGSPNRDYQNNVSRLNVGIGYSSFLSKDDYGDMLVADFLNRRILSIKNDTATELFSPLHWEINGGIQSFSSLAGTLFFTDPSLGQVFRYSQGSVPSRFAGVLVSGGDPEQTRRKEALSSYASMNHVDNVRFGYIQGIATLHDKLLVTDQYRAGIWEIDPTSGQVQVVAGMKAPQNYHFGGFTGNVGLSASEIRFGGLQFLHHDQEQRILLVPTLFDGTIVAIKDDLTKTIELVPDIKIENATHAILLDKNTLVISDSSLNKVHIFSIPNLDNYL